LDHLLRDGNVGLVYSNTITNGEVLASMAGGLPVITHVHELGFWINHRLDPGSLAHTRRLTSLYVAVSDAVRQNLIDGLGIPPQMVETIHEFIPTHVSSTGVAREEVRAALGIPAHAFVVGGSGTTDWRKGPDLFVQLAAVVRRRRPQEPVHFVWIGGEDRGPTFAELWHDVVHAHAADVVHFVGRQPNSLQYFAALDAFAMTSREDPFPLVCLEAALLEKPIVCFEGSGGAAEFVGNDAGIVVPYLDLHGMGEAILRLMDSEQLRRRLGRQGAEKVRRRHDVGVAAPRLLALIRRYVSEAAPDRNGRP
jgi:glycosyltransferase involved in cell wall biosynthesis